MELDAFLTKADTLYTKITAMRQQFTASTIDAGAVKMHLTELAAEVQKLDVECLEAARFSCASLKARFEELHQRLRKFLEYIDEILGQCPNTPSRVPRFSSPSGEAIRILANAGRKLEELEQQFDMLSVKWANGNTPAALIKKQLAELEAQAKRLETDSVDGVSLVQLNSGRQVAKSLRKRELFRLEQMFANIDDFFTTVSEHE